MKQIPVKLGPLALLLALISICLTVLAILNFTTAHADLRLAEKYAETVSTRYELECEAQEFLSRPDKTRMEEDAEGVYTIRFSRGEASLTVSLRFEGESVQVVSWRQEQAWAEDTSLGQLWDGA